MEYLKHIVGEGTHLSVLQMLIRGVAVFVIALFILRIAGKRTFGKKSATDNIIMIMLGAILSRAIVGASPFIPIIICSLGIVLLHRILAWIGVKNDFIGYLIKGEKASLYKNGKLDERNMKRCMISLKDLEEGVRIQTNSDSFEDIEEIFLERNGEISVVKRQS